MLVFQEIQERHIAYLQRYYANCRYHLCEYAVGTKLMWRDYLHPSFAETAGCLVVQNNIGGEVMFDYPIPSDGGDEIAALCAIEHDCAEKEVPLVFSVVPEEKISLLLARYPRCTVQHPRAWCDYLYRAEDLRSFPGRKYSAQRNYVNRFYRQYPAEFRVLHSGDKDLVEAFWRDYESVFAKEEVSAKNELQYAKRMLKLLGNPQFFAGGLMLDGRLISLSFAERAGDMLIIHIEKALYAYDGVYPTTVREFAGMFASEGVNYVNREDDAGNRGLRISKTQYLPCALGEKYRISVENELYALDGVRPFGSERLILRPIEEADRTAYTAMCLDEARNRYWGYDYRDDWHGETPEDYFLDVAQHDFAKKIALNLAITLKDGTFIGEAILYHFTGSGEAELGCRIAKDFAANGYGTEAFAAVADWAIYHLQLRTVVAKCFKENAASLRMLASCMKKNGEDETYFYFKKDC